MKYIAYCRKSTDEKDRQILSIESQIQEIKDFAQKQNLEIVEFATEAKTAKVPGRLVFEQVLKKIEKGEAQGIVSWHPDRLARNSVDGGRIIYLLDTGKLLDLKFPSFWFENSPQGKFVLNMAFGQSKYYVDNLSENVKRGLRQQLRNGVWPTKSPYGYIYNKPGKKHEIDPNKSKLIKKIFQKYACGEWSQTQIANVLFEHGYQRKNGKPLSLNEVVHLLTNKFYIGAFKYNNEWHEASHERFISKNLFDDVQRKLKENKKQFRNLKFPFLGLVKCGECGASITAERKFKFYKRTRGQVEYVYYRCTKKLKPCSQKYIQEHVLEQQLRKIVLDASLPHAWAENWNKWLDRDEIIERQQTSQRIIETESDTKKLDEKLNTLLDGYLDGTIEANSYKNKKNELFENKVILQDQIIKLQTQGSTWLGPMREFIQKAVNGDKTARAKNNPDELCSVGKNTGSDYFLTNRQLGVRYKMGFAKLASRGDSLCERVKGIEPSSPVWKTGALPLSYTRRLWQAGKTRILPLNYTRNLS
ncbi:MAG: hypothetical protein UX42_C0017G0011 [Microgenomates group bacterium GW2011_GWC1_46_20]|nr:MAG: hypothetical protein UX42_C0017G0011 [Microgenomates group bacterium GW2011_GWC1_46_20]